MNVRSLILTAATGVLLTASTGLFAAQAPKAVAAPAKASTKAAASTTNVTHGTIASIDANQVVISEKSKDGKSEPKTFMLDKETAKSGTLDVGGDVTVHYRTDNNHLMATSLVGKAAPKAKTAAKAPAKKG